MPVRSEVNFTWGGHEQWAPGDAGGAGDERGVRPEAMGRSFVNVYL